MSAFSEGNFEVRAYRAAQPLARGEAAFESGSEGAVKQWASARGQTLGLELCQELEQGMGGGIRGDYVSAVVPIEIGRDEQGRGVMLRDLFGPVTVLDG